MPSSHSRQPSAGTAAAAKGPQFDALVHRYYHQLAIGCGDAACTHRLCASSPGAPRLPPQAAAVMAVQLASRPHHFFCPRLPPSSADDAGSAATSSSTAAAAASTAVPGPGSRPTEWLDDAGKPTPPSRRPPPLPQGTAEKNELGRSASGFFSLASLLRGLGVGDGGDLGTAGASVAAAATTTAVGLPRALSAHCLGQAGRGAQAASTASALEPGVDPSQLAQRGLPRSVWAKSRSFFDLPRVLSATGSSMVRSGLFASHESSREFSFIDDSTSKPVRNAYELILATDPKEQLEWTLANSVELLLASLQLNGGKYQTGDVATLPQLLILFELPLLHDKKHRDNLLKRLCLVLSGIRRPGRLALAKVLSRYESEDFLRIVNLFEDYISYKFAEGIKADEVMIAAVKVLSLLNNANELAPGGRLVPLSAFYNDILNRKLNFKDEYRDWRRTLGSSPKVVELSFFNYPFLFDPVSKSRIMHIDAMVQMSRVFEEAVVNQAVVIHAQRFLNDTPASSKGNLERDLKAATNPFLVLEVRRQRLVKDALDQLRAKEADLKKPLRIRFVGGGEEGMDQGGVQKEFFHVLVALLLDPAYGMFTHDDETRMCWVNGTSLEPGRTFELVGAVLGLALYNGVILDLNFPALVYKKLLGEEVSFDDFKDAFPSLGRGLQQLLDWTDGDVSDVFMRSFEIAYEVYGRIRTFPLIIMESEFVDLYVRHYAHTSVERQFDAFRKGFLRVCGGRALKMCRAEELELLLCGTTVLNFHELERGAEYDDGYSADHPVI
ncbi:hypothetical protein HK405_006454, partial [Cladochytrium tenue]